MKRLLTLLFVISISAPSMLAQTDQVSINANYTDHTYYSLTDGQKSAASNTAWDIAFTVTGLQDAGILINEFSDLTSNEVELYEAPTNVWADNINSDDLVTRLYNEDKSWNTGAFNSSKMVGNPLDYGWGTYSPGANKVVGNKVFAVKLRNGSYKKLEIQELDLTTYNFRYADLDGSNEIARSIDKNAFVGNLLVYFSIQNNQIIDQEPVKGWDLLFGRYKDLTTQQGQTLQYGVSGVLGGRGVEIVQADAIDQQTVTPGSYLGNLTDEVDIIGWDWKTFDFMAGWVTASDIAYFVKTDSEELWKLYFIDFEGSSTGVYTFNKTSLGSLSTLTNSGSDVSSIGIFPNPATTEVHIALTSDTEITDLRITLSDLSGKIIRTVNRHTTAGFRVISLNGLDLPQGQYIVNVYDNNNQLAVKRLTVVR